mgnify:CR=1 FL=1
MSRGKRYDTEPKLNMKKVFAVIIAIIVIIMFIFMIKGIFTKDNISSKITSKSYFTSYNDNKWGVIDSDGNNVIDPSYKEMIIIPNPKVPVFICTYDVNYETGEYSTKAINEKNEKIYTQYEKIEAIQNKDKNNNLWYDQEILKVQKDGKYGLIKISGEQILATEYENIESIIGIENAYKITQNGKVGIANSEGKIVVEPKYADIDILGEDNKSGFIIKDDSGKYGIIDYSKNQILENKYDEIEKIYGNDLYVVSVDGKQKLVNKANEDVLTKGFDSIKQVLEKQENAVVFVKSNKYGVMNLSGEVLIEAKYDDLKETKTGLFIAKKDDKYGIIDIQNQEKLPFEYTSIVYNKKANIYVTEDSDFNSNVLNAELENKLTGILIEINDNKGYLKLRINDEYKYYNFKFEEKQESDIFANRTLFLSKKDGKYGFVDKNGKVVVDYIYDDAIEQNDYGYSAVKKEDKWGSIDAKGKVVQEPIYNLDDYLLINFVGRWHLGLDINMNYYNQI